MSEKITVRALEEKIFELEEVVVTIRAPSGQLVDDYEYERKAAGTSSVTDWLDGRVKPLLGGHEVVVINGDYATPHGRTKMSTLRDSYEK